MQTREWEDQTGNKRWTTEVVLQGFNSALTMLDTRGQGGAGDSPGYGGGSDFGRSSPMEQGGERRPARDEMDDEIPF